MDKLRIATLLVLLTSAAALAAPPADDAWVAAIEGGWTGVADRTPMGEMPFAMIFDRDADGSLHCRTGLNTDTYIALRFHKDGDGRWMLEETAGLEGQGVQSYTLAPVDQEGPARRWVVPEKPGFMAVDMRLDDGRLSMQVQLRGAPHASFALERMPDEELPAMRAALERQAAQSPAEMSIWDVLSARDRKKTADPIESARARVAATPDDAEAHMALARELSAAIQADASNGPRYAFELLQTLERTVELDPTLGDAYAYLVGYYLNAPPIAGGSVEKAETTARKLAEIDTAAGETLLAQVARHRAAGH